jgi:hypothetical protein
LPGFSAYRLSKPHAGSAPVLVDELDAGHYLISSSEVGAQRSLSDFFSALTASSTILLIASARDGTSIWPRRQSSTIRKKDSDTRI